LRRHGINSEVIFRFTQSIMPNTLKYSKIHALRILSDIQDMSQHWNIKIEKI